MLPDCLAARGARFTALPGARRADHGDQIRSPCSDLLAKPRRTEPIAAEQCARDIFSSHRGNLCAIAVSIDGLSPSRSSATAPRRTFGGLFSAGLARTLATGLRFTMWSSGTAALSAVLRETLKIGPRHEAGADSPLTPGASMWVNAAAGSAVAYFILSTTGMEWQRRIVYSAVGGMSGVAMPVAMMIAGPYVRRQLTTLLGEPSATSPVR